MRVVLRTAGFVLLSLSLLACAVHLSNSGSAEVPPKPGGTLRVATYNVHYIRLHAEEGDWSVGDWDSRKAPMADALKAVDADIVAFQEMESFGGGNSDDINLARSYLLQALPGYEAAAIGDWRDFPSTQPIFYRRDALALVDQGWFFFSDTPEVIYSRTFDGSWPAFATWAEFRPREGGPKVRVYNMHFEYKSRSNRRLSAELVARRAAPVIARGEPVILLGDINARSGSEPMRILAGAGLDFAPVGGSTYHFDLGLNLFGAIDHVGRTPDIELATGPLVLRRKFRGEWPSDHYPVYADLRLPADVASADAE